MITISVASRPPLTLAMTPRTYLTGAPVGTRLLLTVVDLHLTVCPHEAAGTVTGVAALAGVLTDRSIPTPLKLCLLSQCGSVYSSVTIAVYELCQ